MNLVEKTVEFITAIEAGNWYEVEESLDDDFLFYGSMPDPFDKETWMAFQRAVRDAFPDWAFHLSQIEQTENKVVITIHITGTHSRTLNLPVKNTKQLPPTHTKVDLPLEKAILKFKGDKIEAIRTNSPPHGGFLGLLEQLGVE